MTSWCSCKNHMRTWLAFVSQPGSETSPILLKFLRFSAQISGYSADFHRKSLDITKQHPNNAAIWANSCFSPVIIRGIGEHKFDGYSSEKIGSWKNGKKIRVLAIQKVAKTGNIGKKSSVRRYRLCKIPQHAEDYLELSVSMREMTQD